MSVQCPSLFLVRLALSLSLHIVIGLGIRVPNVATLVATVAAVIEKVIEGVHLGGVKAASPLSELEQL